MKKQKINHLSLPVILLASFVTGAFGVAIGTFIVSAHGGDATKIHACKTNSSGTLRVVGENDDCRSNESPLDWNTQGLQGEPGPTGVPGSGGSLEGFYGRHHKALVNNASNDLFTFPLAEGEEMGFTMDFTSIAKKGSDWSIMSGVWSLVVYNDGGTLRIGSGAFEPNYPADAGGGALLLAGNKSSGSSINLDNTDLALNATLAAGVVTLKYNTGNIGTDPDSIGLDYALTVPTGQTVTFLP